MNQNLQTYIEQVKARVEVTTEGPWKVETVGDGVYDCISTLVHDGKTGFGDDVICDIDGDKPEAKSNAKFIAHARTDVPTLIKIVEMAIETMTSIAAEKCKPSFDSVLNSLERGKLISIIDTDTALARQFLQDAAKLAERLPKD